MNYVEILKKQYIKYGKKGYTIYNVDITTQTDLREQGFEDDIGGYSGFLHYQQDNNLTEIGLCSNKPGCYGDYDGGLKINQVALEIGDPINNIVVGGWFNRQTIAYSRQVIFENKSMDVEEIEEAYMWFESFKTYNRYDQNLSEELHELLYKELIETGKYKTHDFRHSVFEVKQGEK